MNPNHDPKIQLRHQTATEITSLQRVHTTKKAGNEMVLFFLAEKEQSVNTVVNH